MEEQEQKREALLPWDKLRLWKRLKKYKFSNCDKMV